ncbi:MAG: family 78 glycoside hydrolase catalytic domain [Alistipes indistinctus]
MILGQNASGIVQLTVRAVTPQSIKLIPGELINDDSTVNQRASGAPFYHVYTARGDGSSETWHPQFTYYGFRYVEVEGAIPPRINQGFARVIDITGLHTRNSAAQGRNLCLFRSVVQQRFTRSSTGRYAAIWPAC